MRIFPRPSRRPATPARPTRLGVHTLDERVLPSATVLDLTTAKAQAAAPSGAIVQQTDAQPTGTGFIHSFVRLQGAAGGGGSEQGFNTDGRPLQFDENKSPKFTRSLKLADVPVVNVGGTLYREFLLDINQRSSSPLLSVDEVKIYLAGVGNLTSLAGRAAAFDLDAGGDVSVKLNAGLNSGSGSGDMRLLVPNAAFAGADPNAFLYLYSKMGGVAGATANGGFEEWAVKATGGTTTPTGTASLSGFVRFDANQDGVIDAGIDYGIAGATVRLQGVTTAGLNVDLVAYTDANGAYTFAGLEAGLYTVIQDQPGGTADGLDYVGTVNGVAVGSHAEADTFFGIQLDAGQKGIDYIFTERYSE